MSRSPTTPDKRVGYPDSRQADGWAKYASHSVEGEQSDDGYEQIEEEQDSESGTGPNPNATGPVMRQVVNYMTGCFEDSNGFAQVDNELQALDHPQPTAKQDSM